MGNLLLKRQEELYSILKDFGTQICKDKEGLLTFWTTSTSIEDELLDFSLYILAPEIEFEYRVINAEFKDVSTLNVAFYTLATKQVENYKVNISLGSIGFKNLLLKISQLGLFKAALESLINQVKLKREYKSPSIKNEIIIGQARTAILQNGERINAGWMRFEGDDVVYYTGKGLREMWKPNMNAEEQEIAKKHKQKTEQELIGEGLIARNKIADIKEIL